MLIHGEVDGLQAAPNETFVAGDTYFLTNLRSVLAGGPDVRDFGHPEWNDSVSIGWVPPTAERS